MKWVIAPLLSVGLLTTTHAQAQERYPTKPVTIVVPYATGTTTDLIARAFAPRLGEILAGTVVVQNRPGAGGTIATQSVATATPDGYTLLMANSTHAINPALYTSLAYDSRRDFAGVALVAESAYLIVASPQAGAKTLREFITMARQAPGRLNYASAGIGTSTHLAAAYFSSLAGIDLRHVPYKNSSDYISDMLGGRVEVSFVPTAFLLTHIKSGKLLALGVSTRESMHSPVEVPSTREAAGIDYEYTAWFGLLAPSRVSPTILTQLSRAVRQAQEHPDIRTEFAKLGLSSRDVPLAEFDAYVRADMDKLGPFVKASGARAE